MVLAGLRQVKTQKPPTLRPGCPNSGPHPAFAGRTLVGPLGLDTFKNLFTVHGDIFRRVDTHTHLIALDAEYRDRDFLTDHDGLSDSSRENEHAHPFEALCEDRRTRDTAPPVGPRRRPNFHGWRLLFGQ